MPRDTNPGAQATAPGLRNTDRHYGTVAKGFHWLTALLILCALVLGTYGTNIPKQTEADITHAVLVFSIHKTVGIAAFFVAVLRILWAVANPRPGLMHPERRLENIVAQIVHWMLYGSLVLVPMSGWIHHAATEGFAPILWPLGQGLPLVPKSVAAAEFFGAWHFVFTKVLFLALALHIAGALKHHLIDKDATLRRMLAVAPAIEGPLAPHGRGPVLAALIVWAGIIGLGSWFGMQTQATETAAGLAKPRSDWVIEDGTLEITIQQFGADIRGNFSEWTADITYDPETGAGAVEASISVGSLTLGSVTEQALGADYLAATAFPVATFAADIARIARVEGTAHQAVGTLGLHGRELPLTLGFVLNVEGDVAHMTGQTVVNRIDFNVGATTQPTEANLGFNVGVDVVLTAKRGGGAQTASCPSCRLP
ncbi:MAG: cytochrome b/b6 domain-containing protein [Rhodobacteraceae bacterium]|nr:cytochrome b/b6 domain-containing protein [Paracoccaceae bacterium]